MTYIVICTSSVSEGGRGAYEQATRQTFPTHAAATEYASGISPSRQSIVVPLQQPTCATCKHWHYAPCENWENTGSGIELVATPFEEGPAPRSNHGRCRAVQHVLRHEHDRRGRLVALYRREPLELNAMPAVACDSEEHSAWLCTLPTFGCVLHEPKEEP